MAIPVIDNPAAGGARPGRRPISMLAALRRCRMRDATGIAALEFALAAPILILIFGGVTDLSIAIWDHMTTVAAVEAGADYALTQGQPISTSSQVAPFLSTVAGIVAATSRSGATLSMSNVIVTYNDATDSSNLGSCYCVPASGVFPASPTGCGAACPDGTTAGAFVQIRATYMYAPLSPVDAPFLSGSYTDTATVRVK